MARRLILPTLFIIVAAHSANANGEGTYTTEVPLILRQMEGDHGVSIGSTTLKQKLVAEASEDSGVSLRNICDECDLEEKLSICVKAVQHKWKILGPRTFTVDPSESDCACRPTKFYGKSKKIYKQQMYLCPTTTMDAWDLHDAVRPATEPPFFIGQGLHSTQYRVRIFKRGDPATVEGQVTGLSLDKLNFKPDSDDNYVYESGNAVSFKQTTITRQRGFEWNDSASSSEDSD